MARRSIEFKAQKKGRWKDNGKLCFIPKEENSTHLKYPILICCEVLSIWASRFKRTDGRDC